MPVIFIVAAVWVYTYFWLAQRRRYYSKFKRNLFFAGSPVFMGWAAYMFTKNIPIGLGFASPLIGVDLITLILKAADRILGPARRKT